MPEKAKGLYPWRIKKEYIGNPPTMPDGSIHYNNRYPKLTEDDKRLMYEYAKMGCPNSEIARLLVIDASLLSRVEEYKDILEHGRASLNLSVRKRQLERGVIDGDVQMLKFLGQQLLGQREKTQTTNTISFEKLSDAELETVISECEAVDTGDGDSGNERPQIEA